MSFARSDLRRTGRIAIITTALGLALAGVVASPALATGNNGPLNKPQPLSKADTNPGGANGKCLGGQYCSTRNGSVSLNGNGKGAAHGKPCAGCVGKADNKNPPGQMSGRANSGYECDANNGIGRSNPAHTACAPVNYPPKHTPPKHTPPKHTPPKVCSPKHNVPKVCPPKVKPPVVNTPVVNTPVVNTPVVNTPVVNTPVVNTPVVNTPVGLTPVVEQPQVLGSVVGSPQVTNPVPTSAAAGQASTGGQLVAGGIAAFAAVLALGTGFVLRRRHGDA